MSPVVIVIDTVFILLGQSFYYRIIIHVAIIDHTINCFVKSPYHFVHDNFLKITVEMIKIMF